MSERVGSEIERLWKLISRSAQNRRKMASFKFRAVLCRIRLFPALLSKIKWFGSKLPLITRITIYIVLLLAMTQSLFMVVMYVIQSYVGIFPRNSLCKFHNWIFYMLSQFFTLIITSASRHPKIIIYTKKYYREYF